MGKAQRVETLNAIAAYAALAALGYTLATLHTTPGIVAAASLLVLGYLQEPKG